MFSCDYNGWADVPEEEREAIEAFEAALRVQRISAILPSIVRDPRALPLPTPECRAA
jgi:hypothetical protein